LEWGWLKNPDTREFASVACDAPPFHAPTNFSIFGLFLDVSFEGNIPEKVDLFPCAGRAIPARSLLDGERQVPSVPPLTALLCTASFGASVNAVADCSRAPHLDAAPDLALFYQIFEAALFLAAR
jgi:hypothetical protein